jgi:hypothetical protein
LVDAGGTGVQFDMTKPNPHGNDLAILSPYATRVHRRWSLPDAIRSFLLNWPAKPKPSTQNPRLETTCLGYDGVTGERQFNIDTKAAGSAYAPFGRSVLDTMPWADGSDGPDLAKYAMLARDGVSCTAMPSHGLGRQGNGRTAAAPENACVAERQALLIPSIPVLPALLPAASSSVGPIV